MSLTYNSEKAFSHASFNLRSYAKMDPREIIFNFTEAYCCSNNNNFIHSYTDLQFYKNIYK